VCDGDEAVKSATKEIADTNSQSEINQGQHESNDEVQMTNDENNVQAICPAPIMVAFRSFAGASTFARAAFIRQLSHYGAPRSSDGMGANPKRAISSVKHGPQDFLPQRE